MNLTQILSFLIVSLLIGRVIPKQWRGWAILGASIFAIFWMQPSTPIRNLDFWLPVASIVLTITVWVVTRNPENKNNRSANITLTVILVIMLIIGLTRYFRPIFYVTPSKPPVIWKVLVTLLGITASYFLFLYLRKKIKSLSFIFIVFIILLFIILKSPRLATEASALLRDFTNQSPQLASPLDIPWLGFSYLAFRLIHVLRDHQNGKLPSYSLGDFVTYGIFFPAFPSGPIDRSQHFIKEINHTGSPIEAPPHAEQVPKNMYVESPSIFQGSERLIIGMFKKFVLADTLALIALNPTNATQIHATSWAWVLLYAYGLRLYFDFSGYTDIAIGLAALQGIRLPENFKRPYRAINLTQFWNSWHITLAQWFRSYYFNPLTRFLRSRYKEMPIWSVIFIGQFTTMVLIGVWHGISYNFAIWGAWHGAGLFIQNRWSAWIHPKIAKLDNHHTAQVVFKAAGWFLTLNFVMLGWVWFIIPDPMVALDMIKSLFGL